MNSILIISVLCFLILANFTNVLSSLPIGDSLSAPANLTLSNELMTPNGNTSEYKFVSVGDWGCTEETDKTMANIATRSPDLVIGLGDYSYSNSPNCWLDKIKPVETKFKIALGNHENAGNYPLNGFESLRYSSPDIYMKLFGLENQYYSFQYGNVHFLIMSTEVPYESGSAQYNFASKDLIHASKDSSVKWIIVANHRTVYPPYNVPSISFDTLIGNKFRDTYHSLFDLYGVDLVLQGHVHYYQRTFPLKYNDQNPDRPVITDQHKNIYNNPSAPIFITVGTGGVEIGHVESIASPYYSAFSQTRVFGILSIEIKNDGSALRGTFYNNGDIGKPFVQDNFVISKSA